jgi:hypothetical protein
MARRTKEQDLWHERGFASGIAVACSTMVGVWGEEVAAEEILRAAGLTTRAKMKVLGVDNYDLDILRPIFKAIRDGRAWKALRDSAGAKAL